VYEILFQKSNRIIVGDKIVNNHDGLVTAKLIVNNFTVHDSGSYSCVVTDHDDKRGSSQINVTAFGMKYLHIIRLLYCTYLSIFSFTVVTFRMLYLLVH